MLLNPDTIMEISQKTPTAEAFFEYASQRERSVRSGLSRLPRIRAQMERAGFHPAPQDLLTMFRELERAGVGRLEGDKFQWQVPIRQLGEYVGAKAPAKPKTRSFVIYFESGRQVSISYTQGLTKEESAFIADCLLTDSKT